MTEFQKWIASISGAVVGQIAVLAFFYLLVSSPPTPGLAANSSSAPTEVTVMLSQLVEQAREELPPLEEPEPVAEETMPEPPEPEPELVEEIPVNPDRAYINTDSNTARADAPENARFESDKNTTASTEFLPDSSQPQTVGPTMRGDEQAKGMSLANQDYTDGKIKPDPAAAPAMVPTQAQPGDPVPPVEQTTDTPPAEVEEESTELEETVDKLAEGEAGEAKPGEADTPPDRMAETLTQPETQTIREESQMASTTESYVDPADVANVMKVPALTGETDQQAFATKLTEEFGEPAAPEEKKEIKSTPVVVGQSVEELKQQLQQAEAQRIQEQLDKSMFSDPDAYRAFQRRNQQNGDVTTLGEGSVDAESTETGKYKKRVEQVIGKKWHQYRLDRGQDVSWAFLRVRFIISTAGKIQHVEIIKKEATELVTEFSLRAIVDAKIPPMPPEVAKLYSHGGLEMFYNIQIY